MTIKDACLLGRQHLAAQGVAEPAIEAEMLLRHVLRMDRARLYTHWDGPLPHGEWDRYQALLEERGRGRPVHYIVGEREFMGLRFAVDERVMIPRPETELLVEHTAAWARHESAARLVDVGTGSGCVAVSLARLLPDVTIYATDISSAALGVARENARRHGVDTRVQFVVGDLLSPLPRALAGRVDAIASNPPYVPESQAGSVPREIRDFEPHAAIFAPDDGTGTHRRLVGDAPAWLRPGGLLAVEVGQGQAGIIGAALRADVRYTRILILRDGSGVERVVAGTFQPNAK